MGLIGSIVGSVAGGAASLFGGLSAGNRMAEADEIFNKRMDQIKAHRDKVYYQDPTQSADNQAALTNARKVMKDATDRAAATAAVTGGTDESVALAKQQAAETTGNMLQQQAVQGAQRREQVWDQADSQLDAYSKYLADSKKAQGQAIANAAGGVANAAQSIGSILPW